MLQKGEACATDTENKLWTKAKHLALKRYHPDKIDNSFSHLLSDGNEKDAIIKNANMITQIVTTLCEQILSQK